MSIRGDHATRCLIRMSVDTARRQGANCVVLSVHWGPNLRTRPTTRFQRFARNAIEDGVDVVHGHSAHLIQGIEIYKRGVILYDTGDFMSDYWVFPGIRTDRSALFQIEFQDRYATVVTAVPVSLQPAVTGLATGREFQAICDCLTRRSRALGTVSTITGSLIKISVGEAMQVSSHT